MHSGSVFAWDFLAACDACDEYTCLHRWRPKEQRFQGEHSLLYNSYDARNVIFYRFLLSHIGHPVLLVHDQTDEYARIRRSFRRFAEDDIDRYVEETLALEEAERDLQRYGREATRHALLVLKRLIETEGEAIGRASPSDAAAAQFLLGKEMGLQWVARTIDDLLSRPPLS